MSGWENLGNLTEINKFRNIPSSAKKNLEWYYNILQRKIFCRAQSSLHLTVDWITTSFWICSAVTNIFTELIRWTFYHFLFLNSFSMEGCKWGLEKCKNFSFHFSFWIFVTFVNIFTSLSFLITFEFWVANTTINYPSFLFIIMKNRGLKDGSLGKLPSGCIAYQQCHRKCQKLRTVISTVSLSSAARYDSNSSKATPHRARK